MTRIADLKENDRLTQPLMVKSCSKGVTQKGAPYLNLVLQDASGTVDAKLWDAKPEDEKDIKAGEILEFTFEVLNYNHSLQLRVLEHRVLPPEEVDKSQFIVSSEYTKEELKEGIRTVVQSIQNETYRSLVEGMLERVPEVFYEYPAASSIHHSYLGGLAEHTLGLVKLCQEMVRLYPFLDYDLLISGAVIHDIGKTAELGGLISGEYTTEGKLIGHISICHGWLVEVIEQKGLQEKEESLLLRHMVLSHHGKLEFGSPIMPELPEAEALSMIDNLDARMNTLQHALQSVQPGKWSSKIFSLDNRQFYKKKGSENS